MHECKETFAQPYTWHTFKLFIMRFFWLKIEVKVIKIHNSIQMNKAESHL